MVCANRFAKPEAKVTTSPIALPHPGKADLRERYNNDLNTLIEAIGFKYGCWDPRHGFWAPNHSIDEFRKGLDKEGLFGWLSSLFKFNKEDRGVGLASPLLELILRFEETIDRIEKAPSCKVRFAPIGFLVELKGPPEAIQRIEKEMDNCFIYVFLVSLKRETELLGGVLVLTFRGKKPWIAIRKDNEILSFFSIPYVPTGPNGEPLDLPIEDERERHN